MMLRKLRKENEKIADLEFKLPTSISSGLV